MNKKIAISTLFASDNDLENSLIHKDFQIYNVIDYNINYCIGCTNCWLKTPGICSIKDDFEILFSSFVASDTIVLLSDTRKGFVDYRMKNIIDRLLPLALPYTYIKNGSTRHKSRYKKSWNLALIYDGKANNKFLKVWFKQFTINYHSRSLGVYHISEKEDLYYELDNL